MSQLTKATLMKLHNTLTSAVRTTRDAVTDCKQALRVAESAAAEAQAALEMLNGDDFKALYASLPAGE